MENELRHTLALKVAYRGEPFSGFARQPDQLTVQGELERALETLQRRPVETTCAGRTDAGVHARGQVVSFEVFADELREMDAADVQAENGRVLFSGDEHVLARANIRSRFAERILINSFGI